jgi:hypothetical protein
MTRTPWTPAELATLRQLYPDQPARVVAATLNRTLAQIYNAAAAHGIKKSAAFFASDMAARIQRGKQSPAMMAGRFQPGQLVWNKGRKGWSAAGTEATRFKKGSASANRQEFGALRINSDGQIDIKIYDGLRAWVQLSHYSWYLTHGDWPARGMCLRFKDGDCHNTAADNLLLITRTENMRMNSVHTNYPPEVARLVQLRGALNRHINQRTRNNTTEARP